MKNYLLALGTLVAVALMMGAGSIVNTPGVPAGAIMAFGMSGCPQGWLTANGNAVSATTYANLYSAITTSWGTSAGNVVLPNLVEAVPVGVGTRSSGVATHDTYALGVFKDDQFQDHKHDYSDASQPLTTTNGPAQSMSAGWAVGRVNAGGYSGYYFNTVAYQTGGRGGTTTHGKQVGVTYCVKF